jgi:hypothetical protein
MAWHGCVTINASMYSPSMASACMLSWRTVTTMARMCSSEQLRPPGSPPLGRLRRPSGQRNPSRTPRNSTSPGRCRTSLRRRRAARACLGGFPADGTEVAEAGLVDGAAKLGGAVEQRGGRDRRGGGAVVLRCGVGRGVLPASRWPDLDPF